LPFNKSLINAQYTLRVLINLLLKPLISRKRVIGFPLALFVFLVLIFITAGIYLDRKDNNIRDQKALSVSEQTRSYLETFSLERKQAIINLMDSWPSYEPNIEDWFNVQAKLLTSMQKGYSSLLHADQEGKVTWIHVPEQQAAGNRLDKSIYGLPLSATGLDIEPLSEAFTHRVIVEDKGNEKNFFLVIGRSVSPQEPEHGYLVVSYNLNNILAALLGDLTGVTGNSNLQFNIELKDGEEVLIESGEFYESRNDITEFSFEFIFREWTLRVQTRSHGIATSWIIVIVGVLMSLLLCTFLFQQLKNAHKLSESQRRFKTASEAALDAIVIYDKAGDDFTLKEANRFANVLFSEMGESVKSLSLKHQLKILGQSQLFGHVLKVNSSGHPYEDYMDLRQFPRLPDWLKIQIVKADIYIVITLRDVSARFSAQLALERSEEKYRRLVDGLYRHFVYTKTPAHVFNYVSAGIVDILGVEPDTFCDKHASLVHKPSKELAAIRRLIQAGKKGKPYIIEYKTETSGVRIIEFSDTPVLNDEGEIIAIEGIAQDVTEQRKLQKQVSYQASHDQLTGLLKRYAFDEQLKATLNDVKQHNLQAVICYLDMDRFKLVNDSCGHPAGDRLLKEVSLLFSQYVTRQDTLARVGGDEFCIIFRNRSLNTVTSTLDELLIAIANYRFAYEDKVFFIGASIGVLELSPNQASAAELIKAADNACYRAKYLGRNRYHVYQTSDEQRKLEKEESDTLGLLNTALQHEGFQLHCQLIQPLLDSSEGIHYEILLRMQNTDGKLISPGLFIPLAERHGLMNKIDYWVVDNTLRLLEDSLEHLNGLDKVAINLSGLTLGDNSTLKKIVGRVVGSSVSPEKICFEITETEAVTNLSVAKGFIQDLRKVGCSFALDDFGAGMSSFTYLKNLDVDYVKIDGSFVQNMCNDNIDFATVRAINNIAQSMGKKTVAEFVSDEATINALRSLNVNYGQGFALGKPVLLNSVLKDSVLLRHT